MLKMRKRWVRETERKMKRASHQSREKVERWRGRLLRVGKKGRSEGVKGVARSEKWLFSCFKPSALWSSAECVYYHTQM